MRQIFFPFFPFVLLVLASAILLGGCGDDGSPDPAETDPRKRALGRRSSDMSKEFLKGLVAKMERDYPPTGHDTWALVDDILSHGDNPSKGEFERRLEQTILKALRTKAENIFGAVFVGIDPPDTDDVKFAITNRTGRKVSVVEGVMQIRNTFGSSIASLNLKVNELMDPGSDASCRGHWPLQSGLLDQLAAKDTKYQLRFVATKVIYTDGTVEVFP
ncbi:MAG: hypothetical protein QGH60_20015 [Phycisphaerae bacterium]|jgi:hypothetical protein|nr:hypothetical protein [Phycisphaerae bacterium]